MRDSCEKLAQSVGDEMWNSRDERINGVWRSILLVLYIYFFVRCDNGGQYSK